MNDLTVSTTYYDYFVSNLVFYTWDTEVELRENVFSWLKARPSCYIKKYIDATQYPQLKLDDTTTIKDFFSMIEKNIHKAYYTAENWDDYLMKVRDIKYKRPIFNLELIAIKSLNTARSKTKPNIPTSSIYTFDRCKFENSIFQMASSSSAPSSASAPSSSPVTSSPAPTPVTKPICSIKFHDVRTDRPDEINNTTNNTLIQYTYFGKIEPNDKTYKVLRVSIGNIRDELFETEWITQNPTGKLKFCKVSIDIPYNINSPSECHTENVPMNQWCDDKYLTDTTGIETPNSKKRVFEYDTDEHNGVPEVPNKKVKKQYPSVNIKNRSRARAEQQVSKAPEHLSIEEYSDIDQTNIAINRSIVISDDEDKYLFRELKRTNRGYAKFGYYENNKPIAPFGFDNQGRTKVMGRYF